MPKKTPIKIYSNASDKKNIELSNSKGVLKNNEISMKSKKSTRKSQGIFFDDDIKDDEENASSQNYWYKGELMKLVPDFLNELLKTNEVIIEQKLELMEALTGCETPNRTGINGSFDRM